MPVEAASCHGNTSRHPPQIPPHSPWVRLYLCHKNPQAGRYAHPLDCHNAPHLPLDPLPPPQKGPAPIRGGTAPVGNSWSIAWCEVSLDSSLKNFVNMSNPFLGSGIRFRNIKL
ncbi:hypothetical protein EVAR_36386_1 [Eumeta japonica]|uniref:Uncharacterized protein n=1 Tax=Eumeta variegata TaxID=151549 RepID=A0A4C1W8B6_EUMVA|nr:hypothetical protein EVAR_36386_1 [Eumeta japonica]